MACNGIYEIGWDKTTPDTYPNAKPTDFEDVKGVNVIHIKNGFYRGSPVSGIFELPEGKPRFINSRQGQRIYVKAHWFCRRPKTAWPTILLLDNTYEFIEQYEGKVVRNIGA